MKSNLGGNKSKAWMHSRSIIKEDRLQKALLHRMTGLSYSQIGNLMGVSKAQAGRYVREAIERKKEETEQIAKQVIILDLARIESHLEANYEACQKGSTKAIKIDLVLMSERQRLLGIWSSFRQDKANASVEGVFGRDMAKIIVEQYPEKACALIDKKGASVKGIDVALALMEENPSG